MKTVVAGSKFVPGKIVVGPKVIGNRYARLVAARDRSGRIEVFDPASRSWVGAGEDVTFADLWRAPDAARLYFDLACAPDGLTDEPGEPDDAEEAEISCNGHDPLPVAVASESREPELAS